jgi:hypothetical protein
MFEVYEPLECATSFRLLILSALGEDGAPCGALRSFDLDSTIPYTAVSYAWGSENQPGGNTIRLNGIPITVRRNIWDFLYHYCRACDNLQSRSSALWIDAICIQQSNPTERSHQVQRMADIFLRASKVLVWLGKPDRSLEIVADVCRGIPESAKHSTATINTAFHQVCRRSYFERLWVVQELALAAKIVIFTGAEMVSWDSFRLWVVRNDRCVAGSAGLSICKWREGRTLKHTLSIADILDKLQSQKCREVHDKIYALLGLITQGHNLRVDYEITVFALWLMVVLHFTHSTDLGQAKRLARACRVALGLKQCEFQTQDFPSDVATVLTGWPHGVPDKARLCRRIETWPTSVHHRAAYRPAGISQRARDRVRASHRHDIKICVGQACQTALSWLTTETFEKLIALNALWMRVIPFSPECDILYVRNAENQTVTYQAVGLVNRNMTDPDDLSSLDVARITSCIHRLPEAILAEDLCYRLPARLVSKARVGRCASSRSDLTFCPWLTLPEQSDDTVHVSGGDVFCSTRTLPFLIQDMHPVRQIFCGIGHDPPSPKAGEHRDELREVADPDGPRQEPIESKQGTLVTTIDLDLHTDRVHCCFPAVELWLEADAFEARRTRAAAVSPITGLDMHGDGAKNTDRAGSSTGKYSIDERCHEIVIER